MFATRSFTLTLALHLGAAALSHSATVPAAFASPKSMPLTAAAYRAAGNDIALTLDFEPEAACDLTVVEVTGLSFIEGEFSNLSQGQEVKLAFGGRSFRFAANYYGGSGNDLVLHWAAQDLAVWGANGDGELGMGNTTQVDSPVGVAAPRSLLERRTVVAIASGGAAHLALCSDGTLFEGDGRGDQKAVDRSGVLAGKTVVSIAAGLHHFLVLCSDGTLVTWGLDGLPLGRPSAPDPRIPGQVDQSGVLAGKTVVKIAAGGVHCLALCSDGTVASWGSGPLGNAGTGRDLIPVLVDRSGVLAGKTVVSIVSGKDDVMAICTDGTLASWGLNAYGELGNGESGQSSPVPVLVNRDGVLAGRHVRAAAAGVHHFVALCSDGTLAAWGYNSYGTLGNGTKADSKVPVAVDQSGYLAGREIVSITAGTFGNLAICSDGSLAEWGDGTLVPQSASRGLLAGKEFVAIGAHGTSRLALASDGTLFAWDVFNTQPYPVRQNVSALEGKTVVALEAGADHSLALCADGTLAAWGRGREGRLGNGSLFNSSAIPVRIDQNGVLAGKRVVAVAAGDSHNLALCSDGTLAAWGSNRWGQLGNGSTGDRPLPVSVDQTGTLAGKTVVALGAGVGFSLALCSDGTVFGWGSNFMGQLGDGTTQPRDRPVAVTRSGELSGRKVVRIAAKGNHTVALCADGGVVTWGTGLSGQLGNGASENSQFPVRVEAGALAGKEVISIAAFKEGSLALCSDGTVAAWGHNGEGQLGDAGTAGTNLPVQVDRAGVLAGRSVVKIAGGWNHAVALCDDSTLVSWGHNTSGQLGIGTRSPALSRSPLAVEASGILFGSRIVSITAGRSHSLALIALPPVPLDLAANAGAFSFDSNLAFQALTVPSETRILTLTPTYGSPVTGVTVHGLPVLSGATSSPIPLAVGKNSVRVEVTRSGASPIVYSLSVVRQSASWDSALSAITTDQGAPSPGFSPTSFAYVMQVPTGVSAVRVSATARDELATVLMNELPPGPTGAEVALAVGINRIQIRSTAADGVRHSVYTLTVTRRAPAPDLADLTFGGGSPSLAFSPAVSSYQTSVAHTVSSLSLTPTCSDSTAVLKVNGVPVLSGTASPAIALAVGTTAVEVSVGNSEGLSIKTYTVFIARSASADATLASLSIGKAQLSPKFLPSFRNYTTKVSSITRSLQVKALAADPSATVAVNNAAATAGTATQTIQLKAGKTTLKVKVTAQDGTSQAYKITITRASGSKAKSASPGAMAGSVRSGRSGVTQISFDGFTYLLLDAAKRGDGSRPRVEVSSNLLDWSSGDSHTETLMDNDQRLIVRDRTPTSPTAKRHIRVRWLMP